MNRVDELFSIEIEFGDWFAEQPVESAPLLDALLFHAERPVDPRVLEGLVWTAPIEDPPDFVASLRLNRLVSGRVKQVVSEFDRGEVSWLPAHVRTPSGVMLPYWLVHYPRLREVYDSETTTYGPSGRPVRWVVDIDQVQDLPVFMVPGASALVFIVHPVVRDALLSAGVTGMQVRRTRTRSSRSD